MLRVTTLCWCVCALWRVWSASAAFSLICPLLFSPLYSIIRFFFSPALRHVPLSICCTHSFCFPQPRSITLLLRKFTSSAFWTQNGRTRHLLICSPPQQPMFIKQWSFYYNQSWLSNSIWSHPPITKMGCFQGPFHELYLPLTVN